MQKNRLTLAVTVAVIVVLLVRLVTYQVRDDQVAVVLTFGRVSDDLPEPGPGLKWPWPIQQVRYFDARLRVLKTPLRQVTTSDQRSVLVGAFALWRVTSARQLLEASRGDEARVAGDVESRLDTTLGTIVSRYPFSALVSTDPEQLRFEQLEEEVRAAVSDALAGRGVSIEVVGLRRLALPKAATEAVFDRMQKEREARAAELRAQGEAEAGRIRAAAEQERDTLLGAAEADARRLQGEAEREAEAHYKRLAEDPELAILLKKLEAMKALLGSRTTLVLDTNQPPFDLLRPRGDAAPVATTGR